jgi:hypothetical protein
MAGVTSYLLPSLFLITLNREARKLVLPNVLWYLISDLHAPSRRSLGTSSDLLNVSNFVSIHAQRTACLNTNPYYMVWKIRWPTWRGEYILLVGEQKYGNLINEICFVLLIFINRCYYAVQLSVKQGQLHFYFAFIRVQLLCLYVKSPNFIDRVTVVFIPHCWKVKIYGDDDKGKLKANLALGLTKYDDINTDLVLH